MSNNVNNVVVSSSSEGDRSGDNREEATTSDNSFSEDDEDDLDEKAMHQPTSTTTFLRPSILKPPTITITPDTPPVTTSMSVLRPSKLLVSSSNTNSEDKSVASTSSPQQSISFVPLTKDSNNVNGDSTEPKKSAQEANEFLFGENLSERVNRKRKLEQTADEAVATTAASSSSSVGSPVKSVELTGSVASSTGEESEINVLQINTRLYKFDGNNWNERVSRGVLRLNDTDEHSSRLIVRTQGSLRLMLNTKLFNGMVVERPNDKSVKFTALDSSAAEEAVKVFLVMGTTTEMDMLYNAMDCRLRRFKKARTSD